MTKEIPPDLQDLITLVTSILEDFEPDPEGDGFRRRDQPRADEDLTSPPPEK